MNWTGPQGPIRIPLNIDINACGKEVLSIKEWAPLKMYTQKWTLDWRAYALKGFSVDPLEVNTPVTHLWVDPTSTRSYAEAVAMSTPDKIVHTTVVGSFPNCMSVAQQIPGYDARVRILYLGSGSIIPKHRDIQIVPGWENTKMVRFHIPVIVPKQCTFISWDRRGQAHEICHEYGFGWYVDTDCPHMVANGSDQGRYHLVVDKFLDEEVKLFLKSHTQRHQIRGITT